MKFSIAIKCLKVPSYKILSNIRHKKCLRFFLVGGGDGWDLKLFYHNVEYD